MIVRVSFGLSVFAKYSLNIPDLKLSRLYFVLVPSCNRFLPTVVVFGPSFHFMKEFLEVAVGHLLLYKLSSLSVVSGEFTLSFLN